MNYCPLCNTTESEASWLGATLYREKKYNYLQCAECDSLYCSPMPDEETLALMYGDDYQQFLSVESCHSGDDGIRQVIDYLKTREKGVFFDYACGSGVLLSEVAKIGWDTLGFELNVATAEKYSRLHNIKIISDLKDLPEDFRADVIHLGDVLEHLTDVNSQFPPILNLLKENGLIIAQGPLEANLNLFFLGIKLARILRRAPISEMPPYHVSLATVEGQRKFFNRFQLQEMVFDVFETAHPAPERIAISDLKNLRKSAFFLLRKVSQTVSAVFPKTMGNRYFYVGSKNGK
ncbi:MAG TPA: methyltransferase domain-containing protein [Pyrinomonadaceae bacterium]|nr:methyltransferase domain-containing protein [Pyrinomonadaceae bacterium]